MNTGLRIEPETMTALQELARTMSARAGGVEVTPTEAARAALNRGITVLQAEFSIEAPKEKKPPQAGQ